MLARSRPIGGWIYQVVVDRNIYDGIVLNEGNYDAYHPHSLFDLPYWLLLPPRSSFAAVLAPCTPSASHVGFSSLRLEPTFMVLGQAAGVAAVLAAASGTGVHAVDTNTLQRILRSQHQRVFQSDVEPDDWIPCGVFGNRAPAATVVPAAAFAPSTAGLRDGSSKTLPSTLQAFGFSWNVRRGWGGPGPNFWSDAANAVFVDSSGALHLVARANIDLATGRRAFNCTEVSLSAVLGYGRYAFTVSGDDATLGNSDPNVVRNQTKLGLLVFHILRYDRTTTARGRCLHAGAWHVSLQERHPRIGY